MKNQFCIITFFWYYLGNSNLKQTEEASFTIPAVQAEINTVQAEINMPLRFILYSWFYHLNFRWKLKHCATELSTMLFLIWELVRSDYLFVGTALLVGFKLKNDKISFSNFAKGEKMQPLVFSFLMKKISRSLRKNMDLFLQPWKAISLSTATLATLILLEMCSVGCGVYRWLRPVALILAGLALETSQSEYCLS